MRRTKHGNKIGWGTIRMINGISYVYAWNKWCKAA